MKSPLTRRRVIVEIAIFAIGLAILSLKPMSLADVLLFSSTAFVSIAMIVLGISLIGNVPTKKILLGLFIGGLWFFLFAVPFSLLPLSPEIPPIVIGFSGLAFALAIGLYERRKTRMNEKGRHAEFSAS